MGWLHVLCSVLSGNMWLLVMCSGILRIFSWRSWWFPATSSSEEKINQLFNTYACGETIPEHVGYRGYPRNQIYKFHIYRVAIINIDLLYYLHTSSVCKLSTDPLVLTEKYRFLWSLSIRDPFRMDLSLYLGIYPKPLTKSGREESKAADPF